MKVYPAYKELGLDFLDSVPTHWDIAKLKYLSSVTFSNVDKHTFEDEIPVLLCNYVDVYKNDFIRPDMDFMKATATKAEISKFTLRQSDVLITKDSEAWDDIAIPAYVTENMDGVLCGYHLAQIRPNSIDGKFLFWVMCSTTLNDQYKVEAHGITRYGLGKDSIENSFIPVPSLPEQQAIADFLDCQTAQIDTLIEKKQRQIDLLLEQRTALINHAVTKGLNPTVTVKDSMSEFYPSIPKHWVMTKLGYLCTQIADGPHYSPEYVDEGILFISARNVKAERWQFDDAKYITEAEYQIMSQRIKPERGDVLYTKGGTTGVARAVDFDAPFQVWVHIIVLKLKKEKVDPFFLAYALNSVGCYDQSQLFTRGATNNDLGVTRVGNIVLGLPPLNEQVEIMNFLNNQTVKINLEIRLVEKMINLLKEYRTTLNSEAVTGKIDVREWKTVHE